MREEKTICIRLGVDELKEIDEKAAARGISRSSYIRNCSLNEENVFDAKKIISYMAGFSNYVNEQLMVGQIVNQDMKDNLKERVNTLWQLLS